MYDRINLHIGKTAATVQGCQSTKITGKLQRVEASSRTDDGQA